MEKGENYRKTQISNNNNKAQTPKRERSSPESINEQNKQFKSAMEDSNHSNNDLNIRIIKSLEEINNRLIKIEDNQNIFYNQIKQITDELQAHKSDTRKELDNIKRDLAESKGAGTNMQKLENKINQETLKLDVTSFGIPSQYHNKPDAILQAFNNAFNTNFSRESFKFINTVSKNTPQLTTKLRFLNYKDKIEFMRAVEDFARNSEGKRQPITVEDIFEEFKSPPNALCGKLITFTNALTYQNQQIIKLKKEVKPYILSERDGRLLLKKDARSRPIEVNSIEEVRENVAKFKQQLQN